MRKKIVFLVLIILVISTAVGLFYTTSAKQSNIKRSSKNSDASAVSQTKTTDDETITLSDVVNSGKSRLFFVTDRQLTRNSKIYQVISIKNNKAALYNLVSPFPNDVTSDDQEFFDKYQKAVGDPVTIDNIENLSDTKIIDLAKAHDKGTFEASKLLAQKNLKDGIGSGMENADAIKKVNIKYANSNYEEPAYNKFKVLGQDNGRDRTLVKETVKFDSSNIWTDNLHSTEPVNYVLEVDMYGGQQNTQATIDGIYFTGIGSPSDKQVIVTKTDKKTNHFMLDKYNSPIISSVSAQSDNN